MKSMYDQLFAGIKDADEKLDSLSDSETAGKRKIGNDLAAAQESQWAPFADSAIIQLKAMDNDELVGCYLGITRKLREVFDELVQTHLTALAEKQPKVEPLISEDEAKQLSATRSEAYQQIKHVIELAVSFGIIQEGEWPMPPSRRGARGKRGKRALSYFNWSIDGVPVGADSNTPAGVSKLLGFESSKDFTQLLRDNNVDTRNPADSFSVAFGGKTISAVRAGDAPSADEVAEDSDEDNGDDVDDDE